MPKITKYTAGQLLDLAQKCKTYAEMGQNLNLTKERIRQIINVFGIKDVVKKVIRENLQKVKGPYTATGKKEGSGYFWFYFDNDPQQGKYYGFSKNKVLRTRRSIYGHILKSTLKNQKLLKAAKEFGVDHLKSGIAYCENPRNEVNAILQKLKNTCFNMYGTQGSLNKKEYYNSHYKKIFDIKKKSMYAGVFYNRLSRSWQAMPFDGKKQVSIGYYPTEDSAYQAILASGIKNPLTKMECLKCGHTWMPRRKMPHICPKCRLLL